MLPDLAMEAARLATSSPEEAELLIATLTNQAIAAWRLDEATFWQRVRFRSRMLRARGGDAVRQGEGMAC